MIDSPFKFKAKKKREKTSDLRFVKLNEFLSQMAITKNSTLSTPESDYYKSK